jgi:hypothetical protein
MWKRWRELESRFHGDWYSDRSARPKTRRALQTVARRIPDADLKRIPRKIVVCAPDPCVAGQVSVRRENFRRVKHSLYLSPQLEVIPQSEVDSIVAHEFAHLVLKDWTSARSNYGPGGALLPCEKTADELMEKWGFAAMNRSRYARGLLRRIARRREKRLGVS